MQQANDARTRGRAELEQEKELWGLQMKKKQASLNSEVQKSKDEAQQAAQETAVMKARCQRALSKARDKCVFTLHQGQCNVRILRH